jgi:hypothetical protein
MNSINPSFSQPEFNRPMGEVKGEAGEAGRLKGTPAENHACEEDRGLVLLQIDGLSFGTLKEAMDNGYAPNMKKMVDSGSYDFKQYFCGIPAETIPILSGFFYGIPLAANDWYDKDRKAMVDSIKEEPAYQKQAAIQSEMGLLADGTSYLSPITGGSGDTALNVSSLEQDKKEKGTFKTLAHEVWKDIKLIKHGGYSITKMAYRCVRDFFKARNDLKEGGQWNTWWDKHYPYLISMADNVFPTIATEGVKQSIDRGLPITYVDYTAYDESGHYYGSKTERAMESIKVLDDKIGQVVDKIEQEKKPYDVVVFSDHGQTDCIPFSKIYGKPIQEMITDIANEGNPPVKAKKGDIEIAHTYSSAGVYFNFTQGTANADQIEKHYPGIVDRLVNHPAMDFVVTRKEDGVVIKSKEGTLTNDSNGIKVEGKDPLAKFGDSTMLAELFKEYVNIPESGDILLFAGFHEGKVIDLNDKYTMKGLHGGFGGEQTEPFMLYGKDLGLEPEKMNKPLDIYHQFKRVKEER